jgi:hypothetical protein
MLMFHRGRRDDQRKLSARAARICGVTFLYAILTCHWAFTLRQTWDQLFGWYALTPVFCLKSFTVLNRAAGQSLLSTNASNAQGLSQFLAPFVLEAVFFGKCLYICQTIDLIILCFLKGCFVRWSH